MDKKENYVSVEITMDCMIEESKRMDIFDNFTENYPEVLLEEAAYKELEEKGFCRYVWTGKVEETKKEELLKLTHHAEGIYEETGAEYVHVEVQFYQ